MAFQKPRARFVVRPTAKGDISSPNFSTMLSNVNTKSSFSTSYISCEEATQAAAGQPGTAACQPL
eukprot:scaffold8129_cov363-Prasinococcus_capsulatus_cf.AAC.3